MTFALKLFGITFLSLTVTNDDETEWVYDNTGGSFDLAPDEVYEDEEYYEEDRGGFGFGVT